MNHGFARYVGSAGLARFSLLRAVPAIASIDCLSQTRSTQGELSHPLSFGVLLVAFL